MDIKLVLSEFVQSLLLAVAGFIAPVLAAWVLAKARQAWADYKRDNVALAYWIENLAQIAVKAAEQAKLAGYITDKRKYAFDLIERELKAAGYAVDIDSVYAVIEAAVFEEFNRGREPEPMPEQG